MRDHGTLLEQARRYRPHRTPVTDEVAVVIQHVLVLGVELGTIGWVRGLDTRRRLQTCGGLLARYLTDVEKVWGGMTVTEAHELFNHDLVDWWIGQQLQSDPHTQQERTTLRLCWAWTAPDPASAMHELESIRKNRPFAVRQSKTHTQPLTPLELSQVCRWLEEEPLPSRRARATFAVVLTVGAGLATSKREKVTPADFGPGGAFVVVDGEQVPIRPEARAAAVSLSETGVSGVSQHQPFAGMARLGFDLKPTRLIDTWVVMQLCDGVAVEELEKRASYKQISRAAIVALGRGTDYSDVMVPPLEGRSQPRYRHLRVVED